ncbi:Putative beta-lactamase/transpeptidase [Septoria linicola]|uniref:Beta-lactamase/transpeptidase n=1 Tax=Septoria linicola TaxID=215465 RepID=A0A9Q9B5E0_9PEZI|nr:putative beta-lactamase/transpeptidase [Septoria linicola]USW58555.1 Putative beta-lactamase/transpeptidase [Septoria linicola]
MSNFDRMLAEATERPNPRFHGLLMKCVDKSGNTLYEKVIGHASLAPHASPLRADATLKIGSATKLITSIALLQCIERNLVGLDDPIASILPELAHPQIVSLDPSPNNNLTYTPAREPITPRHLLSHTSGLGYRFLHPTLMKWSSDPNSTYPGPSTIVMERYNTPLLFEPGQGWMYGSSLDWAGVLVRRLNGNIKLSEYFNAHIWSVVGRKPPFPTFYADGDVEYQARLLQAMKRTEGGGLEPAEFVHGNNPDDEEGGAGLACTMEDFVAVLQDLVKDEPKLLKSKTIDLMFEPQLPPAPHPARDMLVRLKPAWSMPAGPVEDEEVNHGLGGLLCLGPAESIGQPKNVLCWGGASNVVWWICRDEGVAGFFATQVSPFGAARELVDAWKKDCWEEWRRKSGQY